MIAEKIVAPGYEGNKDQGGHRRLLEPCFSGRRQFHTGYAPWTPTLRWGDCWSYSEDKKWNFNYCHIDKDKITGFYPKDVCFECGLCTHIPNYKLVGNTYASCGGTYTMSNDILNGRNIWDGEDNSRFIFWCPSVGIWAITGSQWRQAFLDDINPHCGAFIHSSDGPENWYDADWSIHDGARVV